VEELGMEAVEGVTVAIAMIQEACKYWLDKFNIKELHPFSDI
jgi:molybdenum cofactor biosynthesis enzyme